MSSKVKELLDFIKPLGELYNPIEIEGANKKTDEESKIHVNLNDYERLNGFSKENVIFGVSLVLKESNTWIEFVHDRKWDPFRVQFKGKIYTGPWAKSRFKSMMTRAKKKQELKPETPYKPESVPKIEYYPEINLAEITGSKGIMPKMRECLQELMSYGAASPNDKWIYLLSGDGKKLCESGLVERKRVKQQYVYRVRRADAVKKLLANSP